MEKLLNKIIINLFIQAPGGLIMDSVLYYLKKYSARANKEKIKKHSTYYFMNTLAGYSPSLSYEDQLDFDSFRTKNFNDYLIKIMDICHINKSQIETAFKNQSGTKLSEYSFYAFSDTLFTIAEKESEMLKLKKHLTSFKSYTMSGADFQNQYKFSMAVNFFTLNDLIFLEENSQLTLIKYPHKNQEKIIRLAREGKFEEMAFLWSVYKPDINAITEICLSLYKQEDPLLFYNALYTNLNESDLHRTKELFDKLTCTDIENIRHNIVDLDERIYLRDNEGKYSIIEWVQGFVVFSDRQALREHLKTENVSQNLKIAARL